jgi:transposase-like protein
MEPSSQESDRGDQTMDFPLGDLMDEDACYDQFVSWLHPGGLACPHCHQFDRLQVHRRHRKPILDYRCRRCHRVFNAFTGTVLQGTHRRPSALILILRGIAQGVPTAQLARELNCDRGQLLTLRHQLQDLAFRARERLPLDDPVVEADELYQNAGEKGVPHLDPDDPPRRRANQARGHGNWDNDRPPVCGVVGRQSGQVRLRVEEHADAATCQRDVRQATWPMTTVNTDEWPAYHGVPAMGRSHATVCHAAGEWARDDDGDGIREVHNNTQEGLWTGLRNFLRPFRGVNKSYLYQYVGIFEWGFNIKRVTIAFIRALVGSVTQAMGCRPCACPT